MTPERLTVEELVMIAAAPLRSISLRTLAEVELRRRLTADTKAREAEASTPAKDHHLQLAEQIADELFVNGNGDQARRLQLRGDHERDLGGWSRGPAVDRITEVLKRCLRLWA